MHPSSRLRDAVVTPRPAVFSIPGRRAVKRLDHALVFQLVKRGIESAFPEVQHALGAFLNPLGDPVPVGWARESALRVSRLEVCPSSSSFTSQCADVRRATIGETWIRRIRNDCPGSVRSASRARSGQAKAHNTAYFSNRDSPDDRSETDVGRAILAAPRKKSMRYWAKHLFHLYFRRQIGNLPHG
jgi:hypothetical protein